MSNPFASYPDELRCGVCDKRHTTQRAVSACERACHAAEDARREAEKEKEQ